MGNCCFSDKPRHIEKKKKKKKYDVFESDSEATIESWPPEKQ